MREDVSTEDLRLAGNLLTRFLAGHSDRTARAYSADMDAFARFVGVGPTVAVAQLLAEGPDARRRLATEYVVDLRHRAAPRRPSTAASPRCAP
jgi:hypothetical protein